MPYLASLPAEQHELLALEYLHSLYESILLRDVVIRENIRNIRFLENLVTYLADNMGNLFSANNISKYLKSQRINIPVQSTINYLMALERSFLVHKAGRTDIKGLKIFEIGEKYYFEDIGLRNILVRDGGMDTARLVEQAVYLSLIQQGFTVMIGKLNENEIDFVAEKQGKKMYIQAAYYLHDEKTIAREFGNLEQIPDQFPKYVVSMDEDLPPVNPQGIQWVHLKNFLTIKW
jgi:predicted AAA+ superfamily ATPase